MSFYESSWDDFIKENNVSNKPTIRAGIIPVFVDDTETYYIMSRKRSNNKISDFGGGCKVKINEKAKICMIREATEEGGNFIIDMIKNTMNSLDPYVIYDDVEYIPRVIVREGKYKIWFIVLPVSTNIEQFYIDKQKFIPNNEISNIELLSDVEISSISYKGMAKIFDPSIINFMRYLFSK